MNSLIVLNWNTSDLLIGMYESAYRNANEPLKTIIVDNGSTDKEFVKLQEYFGKNCKESRIDVSKDIFFVYRMSDHDVIIKKLETNIGFAAGNNVGLKFIDEDKNVFFINSDIVIDENDWDLKFEKMFENKKVGIVGCAYHPLVWSKDGRFKIQPMSQVPVQSESVQGAFFAIPVEMLKRVKARDNCYFDENFKYAHYEETDLCFRVMGFDLECWWVPCKHLHLHDKSATKSNGYRLNDEIKNINDFKANSEKNRLLLFKKHQCFFEAK